MAKIDRIKAEISFNEKQFFAALAVLVAVIGWCSNKYQTANSLLVMAAIILATMMTLLGIYKYRRIGKLLEALENVE